MGARLVSAFCGAPRVHNKYNTIFRRTGSGAGLRNAVAPA